MESPKKQAANILRNKKTQRRWLAVIVCLAMLVTTGTVTALKLNGQAMNRDASTLTCNFVPHTHTDECYDAQGNLVCGQADFVVHTHNADCMTNGELTCTLPEIAAHTHTEDCYTLERVLTCGLEESEPVAPHTHTDECYVDVRPLVCGLEEHTHTDACYTLTEGEKVLTCGQAETDGSEGHTHTDACYTVTPGAPVLTCTEDHEHTDACYAPGEDVRTLTCGLEESPAVPAHHHTEDCYTAETVSTLTCDKPEHTHTDACYGEPTDERELVCTLPEGEGSEGHTHTDECYTEEKVLTCTLPALHTHDGSCYDANGKLVCGMLQLVEHVHTPECFTTNNDVQLAAATRQLVYEDANLRLTADFTTDTYLYDTTALCLVDAETPVPTTPNPAPVTEKVELSIEDPAPVETPAAEPAEETPAEQPVETPAAEEPVAEQPVAETPVEEPVAEQPVAETPVEEPVDEEPVDEEAPEETPAEAPVTETPAVTPVETPETDETLVRPAMMAGAEQLPAASVTYTLQYLGSKGQEIGDPVVFQWNPGDAYPTFAPATPLLTQTVVGEDFVVTATYTAEADLPEGAELRASHITDEATVAAYLARYRETLGSEKAAMQMLLDIGFWTGETEVQPAAPVNITLQMLGEDGLPAGEALLIVHFPSDTEAELLPAQVDESNTTAIFDVDGFSPFGVGVAEPTEDGRVRLDGTFEWYDGENEQDSLYHVTFHVKGIAAPKTDEDTNDVLTDEETGDETVDEIVDETEDEIVEDEVATEDGEDAIVEDTEETEDTVDTEDATDTGTGEDSAVNTDDEQVIAANPGLLDWRVKALPASSEAYQTYEQYSAADPSELLNLLVMQYTLYYNGVEMDLSDCEITVEIAPTNALNTAAQTYSEVQPIDVGDDDGDGYVMAADDETLLPAPQVPQGLVMSVLAPAVDDEQQLAEQGNLLLTGSGATENTLADVAEDVIEETGDGNTQVITMTIDNAVMAAAAPAMANTFAARTTTQNNPHFEVQYYAYLDALKHYQFNNAPANTQPYIPLVNTSGGQLPLNGRGTSASPNGNPLIYLHVAGGYAGDKASRTLETVGSATPTKVYATKEFEYLRAPQLLYTNAAVQNLHYTMAGTEIWILKSGRSKTSLNKKDWDCYTLSGEKDTYTEDINGFTVSRTIYEYGSEGSNKYLCFTNNAAITGNVTENGKTYTYIPVTDKTVIRWVYKTTQKSEPSKVNFYDYDITNGKIYTSEANARNNENAQKTIQQTKNPNKEYWVNTFQQGINSSGNYSGKGAKLAFGNSNTATSLAYQNWNGNLLNKHNGTQDGHPKVTGSYKGCTFGLVTGLKSNGTLQYANGVIAPNLFNEGSATGKTTYDQDQFSLQFDRVGDTYTLQYVQKDGNNATNDLTKFNHPNFGSTIHNHIWTNNFWPMDAAESYGTNSHDFKFGDYNKETIRKFAGRSHSDSKINSKGNFPKSDDGKDHNSYFGMNFSLDFDLSASYVGPLNYYFFGDDDMWVFLDGKLVCDIGGVHSSVGEYVNLWDYLGTKQSDGTYMPKDGAAGKHTLTFFYTERGESGSTCWMQFTLPSVTFTDPGSTPEDYGSLKVEKQVKRVLHSDLGDLEGELYDNDETFQFKVNFEYADATLRDIFPCTIYNENGEMALETAVENNGVFQLKHGQYIVIKKLPIGTTCTVTEIAANGAGGAASEYVYETTVNGDIKTGNVQNEQEWTNKTVTTQIENGTNKDKSLLFTNQFHAFNLPKTGGEGVTVYYVGGAALVLAAAGIWFDRRRRKVRS